MNKTQKIQKLERESWLFMTISVDTFNTTILVGIGGTQQQLYDKIKEDFKFEAKDVLEDKKEDLAKKGGLGGFACIENGYPIIWIADYPNTPDNISIVAHESLHAASYLADKVGIDWDKDKSEEFYAYLVSHITRTVLHNYQESIKVPPKPVKRPTGRKKAK